MRERYEVRVRGLLGPVLRLALGGPQCRVLPRQSTIRGRFSDGDLERLLSRLDRSGVELVCLSLVPTADLAAPGTGQPPPRPAKPIRPAQRRVS